MLKEFRKLIVLRGPDVIMTSRAFVRKLIVLRGPDVSMLL